MKVLNIFILLLGAILFLSSCDRSKITESDLPANQKLLSLCVTPWEQTISEGAKVIGYLSDTATCTESCKPVDFTCTTGRFVPGSNVPSGVAIANTKQSCKKEEKCSCQLPAGKGKVSDGFTTKVYSTAQVSCGQICSSVEKEVVCKNGKFFNFVDQTKEVTNYNFSCSIEDCKSCTALWDPLLRVMHGGRLVGYVKDKLTCGFTCSDTALNAVGFSCDNGELRRDAGALTANAASLKTSCTASTDCTCRAASGETYVHNKNTLIKLSKKNTGTCDVACDVPVNYTCEEGKFVNKTTGAIETAALYTSCADTCKYCTFPNGQTVKQGTTGTFYKKPEGTCALACQSIQLRCDPAATTGEIKIISGTGPVLEYKESSCSDTCVSCKLPDSSNLIENAETDLFKKSSAGCGQTCEGIRVVCDKATKALKIISGTGNLSDFKSRTCVNSCVRCTMPDGSKIDAPVYNIPSYGTDKVACGQSCDSQLEYLHCNTDGSVTKAGVRTSIPIAQLVNKSCSMEPCKDCNLPWDTQTRLNNGATTTVYTAANAACGERCENKAAQFRCTDSNLVPIAGTPLTDLSKMAISCLNATCPKCSFNNRDYSEGEKRVAYKNDGTNCSTGACADYKTFTCTSGNWVGEGNATTATYQYGSCVSKCVPSKPTETGRQPGDQSAESGGAFTWMCPVLHSRGFAWEGTTLSYYSKSNVACSDSCNNYRVEVKCDSTSGFFNNTANPKSIEMLYLNCVEQCP